MEEYRKHTQEVVAISPEDVAFSCLIGETLGFNETVQTNNGFSAEEVAAVIKQRPNGSSLGRTGVNIELLKAGGDTLMHNLGKLFQIVYKYAMVPKR